MKKEIVGVAALLLSAAFMPVLAGQNSMPVWDGFEEDLRKDWNETTDLDWAMYNDSGTWKYRWDPSPDTTYGWTIANNSSCMRGALWHYVNSSMVFGGIFAYNSSSDFYAVRINISSMSWYVQHWDGSDWSTLVQSVEGMSYWQSETGWNPGNDSIVKLVWNGYDGTIRWKIWDLHNWSDGDIGLEPFNWTIDLQNDNLITDEPLKMGLYGEYLASGTNHYNDYGNIRIFNLTYNTETDSLQAHPENGAVPLLTVPEISLNDLIFFEGGYNASLEEAAVNAWEVQSFYYDQDDSHPNDTIYVMAGWNRTSQNETYIADGMEDNLFLFWAHVTADNSFDNGTMGDYCRVFIDRNHNHVYDDGDLYLSVWAHGSESADDINGTWYRHNGTGWVEQQLYGGAGDAVYMFPAGLDLEAHADDDAWMWNHLTCIALRGFESSPLRGEPYEQWMFMIPDRVLLNDDVNDFISLGERIGINFYGYGTLAPVWSWSSWNETSGWYSGYEGDASSVTYLGNLAVTGSVLGGGGSLSAEDSMYIWVLAVVLVAVFMVILVARRR